MIINPYSFGGLDPDAQAFLTASGITDSTISSAINTLVTTMKSDGIWTKMKAIYPMVGGTASTHKWNLKDPRDLDAAFRLSFAGGWTHSATGALPNGTNGFADTKIIPTNILTANNWHLSYYSRTNNAIGVDFDLGTGDNQGYYSTSLFLRRSNNTCGFDSGTASSGKRISASSMDSSGFFVGKITASNDRKFLRNNSLLVSSSTPANNELHNYSILLAGYNNIGTPQFFGSKECAFLTIGDGLTDTEASNLYTAVQAFQTTLIRQV